MIITVECGRDTEIAVCHAFPFVNNAFPGGAPNWINVSRRLEDKLKEWEKEAQKN